MESSGIPRLAQTPEPPYYAVIFTSLRKPEDAGYADMASRMLELAVAQPGFLGVDFARDTHTGVSITVSYWKDEASIAGWRTHAEHRMAQAKGRAMWYSAFELRVAKVERTSSKPQD
jgi:heme-degrading monooxygenase HmoA